MASTTGLLVSLEGISGCGKTYFAGQLRARLEQGGARFVSEVSDRSGERLDRKIVELLEASGDRFFRSGFPRAETLLLLALKVTDYELWIRPALSTGVLVVEDRSIDTIAIYQAIMLARGEPRRMLPTAKELYELAAKWRRPPDLTLLIEDDFLTATRRAEKRMGRKFRDDEMDILRNAAKLYSEYAEEYPGRIMRITRTDMGDSEIVETMIQAIEARLQ